MVENFWVEVGFPKGTRWWEPRVATPRVGAAMPSIVDVVMVSAGIMGSILEEVSRKGAARVLVEVGIHRDSMCLCLEGRELAETSQQGAQKNLQQHQQPQQQTDQGNLKKRRPFCFRCKCSGHVNEACKADLDCIICNKKNSHLSSKCPILKIPKPSASFFGSGKKELAFVQITEADYKSDYS